MFVVSFFKNLSKQTTENTGCLGSPDAEYVPGNFTSVAAAANYEPEKLLQLGSGTTA